MITMAGLPKLTIHGLRHTHASILMEKGVSPVITMDIYSHVSPDMQGKRPWR